MAMPEWIKKELRTNFARASRAGRQAAKTEPRAARASYLAKENVLRIELTNAHKVPENRGLGRTTFRVGTIAFRVLGRCGFGSAS